MKKLFLLIVLTASLCTYAQQRNITTTIRHGQNSTYLYDKELNFITVHKQGSQFTYAKSENKDGTEIPELVYWGYIPVMEITDEQTLLMKSIVDESMRAEFPTGGNMFEEVKGQEMLITVFFNSRNGKVEEVSYIFRYESPLMNLPVDVFYSIERSMKENIRVTPTEEGKKLTFLQAFWNHKIGNFSEPPKDICGGNDEDPGEAEDTEEEEEDPPIVEPPYHP